MSSTTHSSSSSSSSSSGPPDLFEPAAVRPLKRKASSMMQGDIDDTKEKAEKAVCAASEHRMRLHWRERANLQRNNGVITEASLSQAMRQCRWPLRQREEAIDLFVLFLASCPDMVDAQVVALAVQYLDRSVYALGRKSQPPQFHNAMTSTTCGAHRYLAAACLALAMKWERVDATDQVVGYPTDHPTSKFNRLIEVFQRTPRRKIKKGTKDKENKDDEDEDEDEEEEEPLTPALLGQNQLTVCWCLRFQMWLCTPAEWIVMVRATTPVAHVYEPLCPLDPDALIPECWLRRDITGPDEDPLPSRAQTAAALDRLPIEEQILLRSLRELGLVEWTPCRLATACMALALKMHIDPNLPSLDTLVAARYGTMPNQSTNWYLPANVTAAVRKDRATSRDTTTLWNLFRRKHTPSSTPVKGGGDKTETIADRVPWLDVTKRTLAVTQS